MRCLLHFFTSPPVGSRSGFYERFMSCHFVPASPPGRDNDLTNVPLCAIAFHGRRACVEISFPNASDRFILFHCTVGGETACAGRSRPHARHPPTLAADTCSLVHYSAQFVNHQREPRGHFSETSRSRPGSLISTSLCFSWTSCSNRCRTANWVPPRVPRGQEFRGKHASTVARAWVRRLGQRIIRRKYRLGPRSEGHFRRLDVGRCGVRMGGYCAHVLVSLLVIFNGLRLLRG